MFSCLFIEAFGHLLGKSLPLGYLVCDVLLCFCHLPIWCPWLGVVLDASIPDLCLLTYFVVMSLLFSHSELNVFEIIKELFEFILCFDYLTINPCFCHF